MSGTPIQLSVTGLLIVFAVLAMLAVVVSLVRRLDERWQRAERRAADAALTRPPAIDDVTLVLISAAIATWRGGRFRIRRVRRLLPRNAPSSPWSHQGRLVLQGSHVVSRRRS